MGQKVHQFRNLLLQGGHEIADAHKDSYTSNQPRPKAFFIFLGHGYLFYTLPTEYLCDGFVFRGKI